jgi:hypothetical protein
VYTYQPPAPSTDSLNGMQFAANDIGLTRMISGGSGGGQTSSFSPEPFNAAGIQGPWATGDTNLSLPQTNISANSLPSTVDGNSGFTALQVNPATGLPSFSYTNTALIGQSISEGNGFIQLETSDYVGAGLGAYSSMTDLLLKSAGAESAAQYGVKYGLPALLSDLPNGIGGVFSLIDTAKAYNAGNYEGAVNKGVSGLGAIGGGELGVYIGALVGGGTPAEILTIPAGAIIGTLGGAFGGTALGQRIQSIGFDGIANIPNPLAPVGSWIGINTYNFLHSVGDSKN